MPLSRLTDGLSTTILVFERATRNVEEFNPQIYDRFGVYWSGNWSDTVGTTGVPPDACRGSRQPGSCLMGPSSMHPGGLNALFADGSVRYVKDGIQSWPFDDDAGIPAGAKLEPGGWWSGMGPSGVWQALGTRAGGEIVSAPDLP